MNSSRVRRFGFSVLWAVLVVIPINLSMAQSLTESNLEIRGHFDVRAVGRDASLRNNNFSVGQLSLDLFSQINERLSGNVEIAYDLNENFVIDEAFIDWTLYQSDVPQADDPVGLLDVAFIIGRFDVPFGLDWRVYSSMDRKLVSMPLVVANTHRGWNDIGVQFAGRTTWSNWSVYAVNGFGTSPALRLPGLPRTTSLTSAENEAGAIGDVFPSEAFGARFGLVVNEIFEFGTSFAGGYTKDDRLEERIWAFDLTADFDHLQLKGEFLSNEQDRTTERVMKFGYYIQGAYTFNSWYGVIRQDSFHPGNGVVYPLGIITDRSVFSTSFGGGYHLGGYTQVRAEYQWAEGSSNDTVLLQTAISF